MSKQVRFSRILVAILVLPAMVLFFIPFPLHWWVPPPWKTPLFQFPGQTMAAVIFSLAGMYLLVETNGVFIKIGKGTLAPWSAPKKLVVTGPYRYMRQPMISGVLLILVGEVFCLRSRISIAWS